MSEAVLKKFIFNDSIYEISEFDRIYKDKHPSVYEVVRIIDGVPVFIEEHYERFVNSARLLGYSIDLKIADLKKSVKEMLLVNAVENYNIKIIINNLAVSKPDIYYFFIISNYPDRSMYKEGVDTILYNAVRDNPNAKVIYKAMREDINSLLQESKNYEAVLVNEHQEVTEGSRSNLFFIKDGCIYTAPPQDVLLGITRQRIITLCKHNNIEVHEKAIKTEELGLFEAGFISGTSPKILPIKRLGTITYKTDSPLLKKVMEIYDAEINKYIETHR